jgi:hypothetical protein
MLVEKGALSPATGYAAARTIGGVIAAHPEYLGEQLSAKAAASWLHRYVRNLAARGLDGLYCPSSRA